MTSLKFTLPSILVAALVLAAVFVLHGNPEDNSYAQINLCENWSENTSPVLKVRLGVAPSEGQSDVTVLIPEDYIFPDDLDRYRSGKLDGAALIYAKLPDFSRQTPMINRDPVGEATSSHVSVLISTFVSMENILEAGVATWGRPQDGQQFPHVEYAHGLTEVDYPIFDAPGFEMFYASQQAVITDVIQCDTRESDATCGHSFSAGPVDLKLSYRKKHLDQWQSIRSAAEDLLGCMLVQPDPTSRS